MDDDTTVTRDEDRRRFEVLSNGEVAGFAEYRGGDGTIDFVHTEVDDRFEGRGLGSTLVRAALDQARADGLRVIATCSFVCEYVERHDEYADLVSGD